MVSDFGADGIEGRTVAPTGANTADAARRRQLLGLGRELPHTVALSGTAAAKSGELDSEGEQFAASRQVRLHRTGWQRQGGRRRGATQQHATPIDQTG